jgi:hypothetical protein
VTSARDAYVRRLDRRANDHLRRQHEEEAMPDPLDAFLTPICSGMNPAALDAGRLSEERRAALDDTLQALADARAHAAVSSRTYVVRGE